jgi:hypothetical protein
MLQIVLLIVSVTLAATLAGAVAGGVTARWTLRRAQRPKPASSKAPPAIFTEPSVDAEIERASVAWANAQGRPEAAGLAADKMHLLHRIARNRGWWQ